MKTVKEEVIALLKELPDTCSFGDILYHLRFIGEANNSISTKNFSSEATEIRENCFLYLPIYINKEDVRYNINLRLKQKYGYKY